MFDCIEYDNIGDFAIVTGLAAIEYVSGVMWLYADTNGVYHWL